MFKVYSRPVVLLFLVTCKMQIVPLSSIKIPQIIII